MAEVAGLVIGVMGLAGLIGAFKDAIELFNDFADSRELGRDFEILDVKLDIERGLLLQWVDEVKLLRTDYDKRLDDPNKQQAVARILACIRRLMSEEVGLRDRFGVEEPEPQLDTIKSVRATAISNRRLDNFIEEFNVLNMRANMRNQGVSIRKRARWMIRDKRKFERLVEELNHFVTKLYQVIPIPDRLSKTDEDLEAIRDLRELKILLAASLDTRKAVAESARKYIPRACEDLILQKLWYRVMDDRHESIAPAHSRTLEWALRPPSSEEHQWNDLSEWLRYDSGIYWMSGKAGSGKSTLMKHLFQLERTHLLLSQWAGGQNLTTAKFYFLNLGTSSLQKSQEGLSRALLYQIFSKHRSLIAKALPTMWQQLCDTNEDVALPSAAETIYAFRIIAENASNVGKFCFFIDGLDEYVGNYLDGIAFIKELAANKNFKILVSSRPIPECVASFRGLPTLHLHHLNHGDIQSYVQDVIGNHEYMQRLMEWEPEQSNEIMTDIVNKSSGVFLWVILACRSLITGFSAFDRIPELRMRVDELPPELEEMFAHMLNKIDKRNREQGARLLRICYTASTKNRSRSLGPLDGVSALGLALVDDGSFDAAKIQKLNAAHDYRLRFCEEIEGRLRSRCGGLLELAPIKGFSTKREHDGSHDSKVESKVIFMHRTVFEFLGNEMVWKLDCLQVPPDLDVFADMSLLRLYSSLVPTSNDTQQKFDLFHEGLEWGRLSDLENPQGRENIFWILEELMFFQVDVLDRFFRGGRRAKELLLRTNYHDLAYVIAVEAGALNYVKFHGSSPLGGIPTGHSCIGLPFLYHAVDQPIINGDVKRWLQGSDQIGYMKPEMVSLLLSSGADPNCPTLDTTPWLAWKDAVRRTELDDAGKLEVINIAKEFLTAGATITDNTKAWIREELKTSLDPRVRKGREELLELVETLEKNETASEVQVSQGKRRADTALDGPAKRCCS